MDPILGIATIALALCTLGLAIIAYMQWCMMKVHAEHLQTLSAQTKEVAEAAKRSASATERAAIATLEAVKTSVTVEMNRLAMDDLAAHHSLFGLRKELDQLTIKLSDSN